jgi:putative acetyltransferase
MNHKRIAIRTLRLTDLEDVHELMLMPQVLWGTTMLPSMSLADRQAWLEGSLASEQTHVFVAEINQKVVGIIGLVIGKDRGRHVGSIDLAVHDSFQGQGIGKMLMLTILDLADNWLNLYRLELTIFTDNERAINLCQRFDFEIEGRKRAASFRGGNYVDSYMMGRIRPQLQNNETHVKQQIEQPSDASQKETPA